ncbi:MAG TPA: hypothetical protein VES42_22485, partial [Pilimelia sp.]|nr:hypothetical protein [Pilimelia sp.]
AGSVRFAASLAVRRPAPAAAPLVPAAVPGSRVVPAHPSFQLFGAVLGLLLLGTLGTMLLVSLPGFVVALTGVPAADPGNLDGLHGWPFLAIGPLLVALGAGLGRRMGRADPATRPTSFARAAVAIMAAVVLAQGFPMFGEGLATVAAVGVWVVGMAPIAYAVGRLARRRHGPLPWLAAAAGALVVIDLAVTAAVWLAVGPAGAPRDAALAWFPAAVLDGPLSVPVGTDAFGDSAHFAIVDVVEFLPHALLAATAFGGWYAHSALRRPQSTALATGHPV